MTPTAPTKPILRRQFRALRQQRDEQAIRSALLQVVSPSSGPKPFSPDHGYIGLYWPLPGEPDLLPLLPELQGWSLALPCSDSQGAMSYRPWDGNALNERDGCGIPAPINRPPMKPHQLQLLLGPALAIDCTGIRLGYGGGYYDRLRAQPAWRAVPALVVLPDACVSQKPLPRDPWDQPFHGWISERGCTRLTGC